MKYVYPLIIGILLIPFFSASQHTWKKVDIDELHGIWDENTYAYKEGLEYFYTTDGGTNTSVLALNLGPFDQVGNVHYLSPTEIRVFSRDFTSVKFHTSSDGGATFTEQNADVFADPISPQGPPRCYFFNNNEGVSTVRTIIDGEVVDVLIRTTDNGVTWDLATNDTIQFDGSDDIIYSRNGTVRVCGPAEIQTSTDKGATWTVAGNAPLTLGEYTDQGGSDIWGVGWAGSQAPCYVVSNDGGASFTAWNIPDENNGGIRGCDNSNYVADGLASIGPNTMLIRGVPADFQDFITIITEDGGSSWSEVTFPDDDDISFGFIERTDDGLGFYYVIPGSLFYTLQLGTVGIGSHAEVADVRLYPNPTQDAFVIETASEAAHSIEITDINGSVIVQRSLRATRETFDRTTLPNAGIYMVSIKDIDQQVIACSKVIRVN